MKAPSSATLLCLAIVLLLVAGALEPNYYPAAYPVFGSDGKQLHGPDGLLLYHRDMTKFYRLMFPAFTLMGISAVCLLWWLVRCGRWLYRRFVVNPPS